jgi:hypothetical protein
VLPLRPRTVVYPFDLVYVHGGLTTKISIARYLLNIKRGHIMRRERGYIKVNGKWVPKDKTLLEYVYTKAKLKNRKLDYSVEPSERSRWIDEMMERQEAPTMTMRKK